MSDAVTGIAGGWSRSAPRVAAAALLATVALPLAAVAWDMRVRAAADGLSAAHERLDELRERLLEVAAHGDGPLLLTEDLASRRVFAEQLAVLERFHDWCPGLDPQALQPGAELTPGAVEAVLGVVRAVERRVRVAAGWSRWLVLAGFAGGALSGAGAFVVVRGLLRRLPSPAGNAGPAVAAPLAVSTVAAPTPPAAQPALPARVEPGPRSLARTRPASSSEQPAIRLVGRLGGRVLVVEDNPINQRVTMRQLDELGVECVVVGDADAALRRLDNEVWDAVLMDIQLPGMDGLTATRRWRAREQEQARRRTPMIAITANAMNTDREACFAAGLDGYIAKPARLEDIHRALARWLAGPSQPPTPPSFPSTMPMPNPPRPPSPTTTPVPPVPRAAGDLTPLGGMLADPEVPPLHDPALWAKLRAETATTDPRMLEELMADLRLQVPGHLTVLAGAHGTADWETVRAIAHRLKGSAGMLGLPRLAQAAKVVEFAARAADGEGIVEGIADLRIVVDDTLADPAVAAL